MHPALSVIIFTTFSGMGYGLFIWLCFSILGAHPLSDDQVFTGTAMSFVMVTIGLLSSTAHLGHPERAWRAFSQWRTSWLSREGIMAILTFGPMVFICAQTNMGYWFSDLVKPMAVFGVIGSIITIYTTSMIYASLKAIPAWHNIWVKIGYQVYALSSGGVAYIMIAGWDHYLIVIGLLVAALVVKIMTWIHVDKNRGQYKREDALGLSDFGKARPFEPAHSQKNYLQREMGYDLEPGKRALMRWAALGCGFIIPAILLFIGFPLTILITVICLMGMMAERWLFFAEAEHVVRLYYDRETV
ncbi:dimethyl sulfoxide reductase anchor subunit family protein [Pseudemcibacter aquimaris]|uniref:dimethyl sulfoxide reductase anchor subunit family protein n=1 Tax=Pseudemcibacter aquimaris TaxID=2857064 RepID=UPI002010CCE7|nr:DmsC/YnfH family molybdoenzyme membrane anchor subunit [Pseudemcibacter aquimaris]MCC3862076.1 dimethyl sulfoxide reductase anchor subunit [Pseudemcibacter aquimaris]WDU58829.1 dimethyl sulfoxide reductase anchor subunit [Pseudemcibacter aquimaris]